MPVTEYQWKSFDGLNLYAMRWLSNEKPIAVVAFVHGHGDHCRRYDKWFTKLASHGISVLALDYRGHGRSEGRRGVINRFDDLLRDVTLLHEKAKELFPEIPVVLYGHSLGATIILSYILHTATPPELSIACSPWLQLKNPPGRLFSTIIKSGNIITPSLTFRTGLHASDFSKVDSVETIYEKDEYVHNKISARLFSEVAKEAHWIMEHFNNITTPLLMMQGRDDRIMDAAMTNKLYVDSPCNISYKEWENAGHQLLNSQRSSEVMDFMIDWIKEKI
jgi:alpha-beta hydrolase superfamily lysophospholipase